MTIEKDEIYGSSARRRPLATRRTVIPPRAMEDEVTPHEEGLPHSYGPEAHERAQSMAYERIVKIQRESPYVAEVEGSGEVEYVVSDYRLYVGMWLVAGISGVAAFLTYSLLNLMITAVAVFFALTATPGRQKKH